MTLAATDFLAHEARALLTRVDGVRPFVMHEAMPPAANPSRPAQRALEAYFAENRGALRRRIHAYLDWLDADARHDLVPSEAQRRFAVLRMRFNRILTQFDLFSDALSQRSERDTGVWLAGLDALAGDGLSLPGRYESPPLLCYLDRGIGAAIRRARTRLPGGGENPVAVIRVPRERMVGTGVASSLLHEVGHQAAALLDLVNSLRLELGRRAATADDRDLAAWRAYQRWISEIVADFWAIARIGVAATVGLVGVVSLPRTFVFRMGPDDAHPFPWIRVLIGCAIGERLHPDPQWRRLAALWRAFYPPLETDAPVARLARALERLLPEVVEILATHRPARLDGDDLESALDTGARRPARRRARSRQWAERPAALRTAAPTIAVAVLGQARLDGRLTPEGEAAVLRRLLDAWALGRALAAEPAGAPWAAQPFPRHPMAQIERSS
ncbi:MAG: hypothetical protein ACFBWO_05300 [Paracoccaceae bacterium]